MHAPAHIRTHSIDLVCKCKRVLCTIFRFWHLNWRHFDSIRLFAIHFWTGTSTLHIHVEYMCVVRRSRKKKQFRLFSKIYKYKAKTNAWVKWTKEKEKWKQRIKIKRKYFLTESYGRLFLDSWFVLVICFVVVCNV